MRRVRVIGGGSWGSALAAALHDAGNDVAVLVRDEATVRLLAEGRCRQLADIPPVEPIAASTDPAILDEADLVLLVVPVGATAATIETAHRRTRTEAPLVLCAKGMAMTADGARLMPELADAMAPGRPSVLLSGPSFADEVMRGLPAAVVAAGTDSEAVEMVQLSFRASQLRVYASDDPFGVAIGGTMKNVIAIAAGCAIGLGLGDNARAAIITRGLAEMARLAAAEGAEAETIYGLSGAGDLALSCAGPHSRNMAYGLALGRGETPDARLAEGRNTVAALAARGRETGIELPITNGVDLVVNGGAALGDVVASLLARPAGSE
ncbi:MAG: NAD(P)H-dependent glycerol-3-phosphate dehydrogenase [SAR116 cluster bacterium]|nr:NAD(P)H-dependent glycerol-3-phosphate dehydrogenase [SAR116 cluster bacterium]